MRVLSYRWGSCYPHSKTASRSTSRGCFLLSCLPFTEPVCGEKYRGAGLARIRIWGGRQRRSYHKCETRNIAGTANRGNKTAPVIDFYGRDGIVLTYQVISALEDFFEAITVVASRLIYKTKYGTLEAEAGSEPFLCFTVIHKGRTTQN